MFKQAFMNFSDSHLIVIGFILFMGTFLGALVWTLFIQDKSFYKKMSEIPLKKEGGYGRQ